MTKIMKSQRLIQGEVVMGGEDRSDNEEEEGDE